jgi:hypothetical protein
VAGVAVLSWARTDDQARLQIFHDAGQMASIGFEGCAHGTEPRRAKERGTPAATIVHCERDTVATPDAGATYQAGCCACGVIELRECPATGRVDDG